MYCQEAPIFKVLLSSHLVISLRTTIQDSSLLRPQRFRLRATRAPLKASKGLSYEPDRRQFSVVSHPSHSSAKKSTTLGAVELVFSTFLAYPEGIASKSLADSPVEVSRAKRHPRRFPNTSPLERRACFLHISTIARPGTSRSPRHEETGGKQAQLCPAHCLETNCGCQNLERAAWIFPSGPARPAPCPLSWVNSSACHESARWGLAMIHEGCGAPVSHLSASADSYPQACVQKVSLASGPP